MRVVGPIGRHRDNLREQPVEDIHRLSITPLWIAVIHLEALKRLIEYGVAIHVGPRPFGRKAYSCPWALVTVEIAVGHYRQRSKGMHKTILVSVLMAICAACGNDVPPPQPAPPAAAVTPPAPDPRIIFDLREKCGRESREWFKQFHADGWSKPANISQSHSDYTNHYNERLNRCFAELETSGNNVDAKTHTSTTTWDQKILVDVSQNQDFGKYFKFIDNDKPLFCMIGEKQEKQCDTLAEWDALAAPYISQ
jgi:hypothetical protein